MRFRWFALLLLAVGCDRHVVDIEEPAKGRALTSAEHAEMQRIADRTFTDVRVQVEGLPPRLTLIFRWGKDVIPETGENGAAGYPGNVQWTVDPDRDVLAIIDKELRPTLFHELHHLARASRVTTSPALRDRLVTEGLATAFERDFGHVDPPWGKAPADIDALTAQLLAPNAQPPDGPRFVVHRVGTHLVDRAMAKTGKSAVALVFATTDEILAAAQ